VALQPKIHQKHPHFTLRQNSSDRPQNWHTGRHWLQDLKSIFSSTLFQPRSHNQANLIKAQGTSLPKRGGTVTTLPEQGLNTTELVTCVSTHLQGGTLGISISTTSISTS
jgi:hypothetical protein